MIITFHQLTEALSFEKYCKQKDIKVRLIPVPRAISSSCGLSAKLDDIENIKDKLEQEDIEYDEIYLEKNGLYEKI